MTRLTIMKISKRWLATRVGSKVCFESVKYPGFLLDIDVISSDDASLYKDVWLRIRRGDNKRGDGCMFWLDKEGYRTFWWIIG